MFVANSLIRDDFGRPHGVLAVNKPKGMTSHDVVDLVRKLLGTQSVGHAGALDPFATGLLILLVGKATKQSDFYLHQNKQYVATVLFGIQTDSGDREGEVIAAQKPTAFTPDDLAKVIPYFVPKYEQYVPVFSSVKFQGEKLRVLARKAENWEIIDDGSQKKFVYTLQGKTKEIDIPKRVCEIDQISIITHSTIDISHSKLFGDNSQLLEEAVYPVAKISVDCSKGTYIRVLAEDIGAKLAPPIPAMLWELQRTRVGELEIENALYIDQLVDL